MKSWTMFVLCGALLMGVAATGRADTEEPLVLAGSGSSRRSDDSPREEPPPVAPPAPVRNVGSPTPKPGKYMVYTYGFGRQLYSGYFILSGNGQYKTYPGGAVGKWSPGGNGIVWTSGSHAGQLGNVTVSSGRYRIVLRKKGASDSTIATGPVEK